MTPARPFLVTRISMPPSSPSLAQLVAVLRLPDPPESRWHRAGFSPRGERIFNVAATLLVGLFLTGWSWTIAESVKGGQREGLAGGPSSIASVVTQIDAPTMAYLADAAIRAFLPLRGQSGRLRAAIQPAGDTIESGGLPAGAHAGITTGEEGDSLAPLVAPATPGIWEIAVKVGTAIKPIGDFNVISLRPFSDKRRGRIGLYYLGSWPTERGVGASGYANPSGFIEVTPENQDTPVSDHFLLRDFLTKNQQNVWPKYLVLETKLLDKLELVLTDLQSRGIVTAGVRVLSGFRTPSYNESGGDPRGRADLSRHMYGDAADIYIDNDGDGRMDDLNGDRRVNTRDARVVLAAVERVEASYPNLVGGAGIYAATSAHGPFIHIDTRGYRARWVEPGGSQ
jgi:uncharacterized protein YcbK (DUF882 family)